MRGITQSEALEEWSWEGHQRASRAIWESYCQEWVEKGRIEVKMGLVLIISDQNVNV